MVVLEWTEFLFAMGNWGPRTCRHPHFLPSKRSPFAVCFGVKCGNQGRDFLSIPTHSVEGATGNLPCRKQGKSGIALIL